MFSAYIQTIAFCVLHKMKSDISKIIKLCVRVPPPPPLPYNLHDKLLTMYLSNTQKCSSRSWDISLTGLIWTGPHSFSFSIFCQVSLQETKDEKFQVIQVELSFCLIIKGNNLSPKHSYLNERHAGTGYLSDL